MTEKNIRVAIIGAGHNGLTCAAYLGSAGFDVTVFEKRPQSGGLCVNETPFAQAPDVRVSSVASYFGMLRAEVIKELKLEEHGLKPYLTDPVEIVLLEDGQYVFTPRDGSEAKVKINGLDEKQMQGWQDFWCDIQKAAAIVYPHYLKPGLTQEALVQLLKEAGLNQLADSVFADSLFELLNKYVTNDGFKAVAATCTPGFAANAGSVFGCIHHGTASTSGEFGTWGQVFGGMGAITKALVSAAEEHGVRIYTDKPVQSLVVKERRVAAIKFEDGSEQDFDIVVSAIDPYVLFEQLLPAEDATFKAIREHLHACRSKVSAAKLHFLTRGLPHFKTLAEIGHNHKGVIVIAPSKEAVERAAIDVPQGRLPDQLMLTMAFPTLEDPALHGSGEQVLTVDVHYLPAMINGKPWSQADDARLVEETIKTIEKQCPELRSHIIDTFVVSPRALAERYNVASLSCWHLPMTPEHLFEKRSLPGCNHYETPIENLFVCSSASYPGGNVTSAPGHNLAKLLIGNPAYKPGKAASSFEDSVRVFAATREHAKRSAEIAAMYEAALGKAGVGKPGHEPYPDSDLFSAAGVRATLEAGERLIGLAEIEEDGRKVIVGAMVADRMSPHHVEFNSMAVPTHRRGRRLGSHIVRGLSKIIDQDIFTVNCTELVTHSLASQAAHFHNGFNSICGLGYCHYPRVFFKDHPESVLWVTRLQGSLVPELKKLRLNLGRGLGKTPAEVKTKVSAALGSKRTAGQAAACHTDSDTLNLLAEVLKEQLVFVPERYSKLVQNILAQFEDILDRTISSTASTIAIAGSRASSSATPAVSAAGALTVDYKEGYGHSYITLNNHFVFDQSKLAQALASIHALGKRFIKVCIPANTVEAIKAAEYLFEQGFVFHSYLPIYGFDKQTIAPEHQEKSIVREAAEFYDVLCLQWIDPKVAAANALPGETDSVIKVYGYPENLSRQVVQMIAQELSLRKQ